MRARRAAFAARSAAGAFRIAAAGRALQAAHAARGSRPAAGGGDRSDACSWRRRSPASGQAEEALATAQPLVAAGDARALLLRAEILAAAGRWAEARPLFHTRRRAARATGRGARGRSRMPAGARPARGRRAAAGIARAFRPRRRARCKCGTRCCWRKLIAWPKRGRRSRPSRRRVPSRPSGRAMRKRGSCSCEDQAAPALQELDELLEESQVAPREPPRRRHLCRHRCAPRPSRHARRR